MPLTPPRTPTPPHDHASFVSSSQHAEQSKGQERHVVTGARPLARGVGTKKTEACNACCRLCIKLRTYVCVCARCARGYVYVYVFAYMCRFLWIRNGTLRITFVFSNAVRSRVPPTIRHACKFRRDCASGRHCDTKHF